MPVKSVTEVRCYTSEIMIIIN